MPSWLNVGGVTRMLYRFARFILRIFLTVVGRWRIIGRGNLPLEGPVMVVCNHVSYWDPVLVGCAMTRQVHFMAKAELFSYPVLGPLVRALGAFPIKRGQSDRNALRTAIHLLQDGKVLGVFPEGTRSKTGALMVFKPGITMLAYKVECPILPVAVVNSRRIFSGWFHPVEVRIGEPIEMPHMDKRPSSEVLEELTEKSRQAVEYLIGA